MFVFPGQGSQWWGMGRALLDEDAVFRQTIEECDALFTRHAAWSLVDELRSDEASSRLHGTAFAQPALFAMHVGLAAVWRSRGIEPNGVVGHSLGEIAAAHFAGALSLCDAVSVVFHRSRLMQLATGKGKMAAVELSVGDAAQALRGYEDRVSIAAVNSPSSTVLSGDSGPLEDLLQALQDRDVFFRYLPVNYAFHSHHMEPYLSELAELLRGLVARDPTVPVFSTVLGRPLEHAADFGADYWVRNVRQTVRFADAIDALIEQGYRRFVELSPHPTLSGVITQCLKARDADGVFVPSLRRGEADASVLLGGVGALYVSGCEIDWRRLYPDGRRLDDLPRYAWNHERHWVTIDGAGPDVHLQLGIAGRQSVKHPLLGRRLESAQPTWRTDVGVERLRFFQDHRVQDSPLLPAAAFIEMGLAAGHEALGGPAIVTALEFRTPLLLSTTGETSVDISVTADAADGATFRVVSPRETDAASAGPPWTVHALGQLRRVSESQGQQGAADPCALAAIRERCSRSVLVDDLYRRLASNGLHYGPLFRGIEEIWSGHGEALARVSAAPELRADLQKYHVHPAVLDSCFQALAAAIDQSASQTTDLYLPVGAGLARVRGAIGPHVWCHARIVRRPDQMPGTIEGDVRLMDEEGRTVVEVSSLRLQRIDGDPRGQGADARITDQFYEMEWLLAIRPGQQPAAVDPDVLPSPYRMRAELEGQLGRLIARHDIARFDHEAAERWGDAQALRALRQLGWNPVAGDRFTSDVLQGELGVVAQHAQLLRRLLSRLEEAGALRRDAGAWVVVATPEDRDPEQCYTELLASFPSTRLQLQLQHRCGTNLADVLCGTIDPLALMFPDGSMTVMETFYQEAPFAATFSQLIYKVISVVADRATTGRTLRILELGAGTGGTTAHILPWLSRGVEYVYTDVSPIFTAHGERKFGNYSFCRFDLLDIEKDPLQQGFSAHAFDVIIASNVLHATIDLRRALDHVKTLLADRGKLVLGELTGPTAMFDIVFGMTEGWWRFQDFELRPSSPLLTEASWVRVLTEQGFSEAMTVPGDVPLGSKQTVVLAQGPRVPAAANKLAPAQRPPSEQATWLILGDCGLLEQRLISGLRARGDRCIRVTAAERYAQRGPDHISLDPAEAGDFRELIRQSRVEAPAVRGVIDMWSLAESDVATMPAPSDASINRLATRCFSRRRWPQVKGAKRDSGW